MFIWWQGNQSGIFLNQLLTSLFLNFVLLPDPILCWGCILLPSDGIPSICCSSAYSSSKTLIPIVVCLLILGGRSNILLFGPNLCLWWVHVAFSFMTMFFRISMLASLARSAVMIYLRYLNFLTKFMLLSPWFRSVFSRASLLDWVSSSNGEMYIASVFYY